MATQDAFSEAELAQLRGFPEINRTELIRYFTLAASDEAFLWKFRRPVNVVGVAVQLCMLPWLGYVPDDPSSAPAVAVARLCEQLGIGAGELAGYGVREQTRTDHLREVAGFLGWRSAGEVEWKELDEFLSSRAMEHDSPRLLFRLACEYLISSRVIRPGAINILRRVAAARKGAEAQTHQLLEHELTALRVVGLDAMLEVDPLLGYTRLHWLSRGATQASPAWVKTELEKLAFLRRLDAHQLDLSMLPAGPNVPIRSC